MNKYKYVATDKDGKKIKGHFISSSESEMKQMLQKAGYYVISSHQVSSKDVSSIFSLGKIKVSELSNFCTQFSVMINAGISIVEAIEVSVSQNYSPTLKNTLKKIQEDMKQGLLLSQAMAKYPKVFPNFFSSMIYVGEAAGCLDKVLVSVAEYYEFEDKTKKKVVGSLAYPILLLVLLVVVVIALMLFVIPRFMDSFGKMDIDMPGITLAIFDISVFLQENWLMLLLVLIAIICVLFLLKFLPSVQYFYDKMKVKLPLFKKVNMALFTSRLCRSLGLLLSSGADSLSALESIKATITNKYLAKQFDKVINDVKMGFSLSNALASEMELSPVIIQMIIVGEKTGELDTVLIKTAPYFSSQAENALTSISSIIQPVILVLLGAVIAVLFISIYSPILEMIKSLQV